MKTAAETKGLPLRLIKHYEDTHSVHAGAAAIERNLAKMIEFNSLMNTGQKFDYDKLGKLFDDAIQIALNAAKKSCAKCIRP